MTYYLKKHWKINLLICFLQIMWGGTLVLSNLALMQMAQGVIDRKLNYFLFWMLMDLILYFTYFLLDGARSWAKSRAIRSMNNEVRKDIVATMLHKSHQEYHAQQSGEYLSWFTNDVTQIENLAWTSFFDIFSVAAQVVFSIIALAMIHWSLLAASFLAALFVISAPKLLGGRIPSLSESCAKEQAQAMSKLKDLLAGLDILRFFDQTKRFVEDNRAASDQLEQPKYKLSYIKSFIGCGIDAVSVLCQLILFSMVCVLAIKGIILQSAIMGGGNLCGTIYNGLATIGQSWVGIKASKPYFEKITIHADDSKSDDCPAAPSLQKAITLENVSFQYGDKPILQNMSLRFEKGGKYAVTGPSGCGKSTMLKLILGWLPAYSGEIRFDDRNAREFTTEQIQRQMSYIEQDVFLFNTTIRDNITLGKDFTNAQMEKALKDSALESDLADMPLGLDTPVGEDGSNLSGGQKQRVAIARALIHNRSILLVDEGTSALDQKNADIVEQSLLNNPDLTLILISHHLSAERKAQFNQVFELRPVSAL